MSQLRAPADSDRRTTVINMAIILSIALAIMLALKWTSRDVDFSRKVFKGIVNGDVMVEKQIDWPQFQAVGADVGKEYRLFRLEKDRVDYKSKFIQAFSLALRLSGRKFGDFVHWRVSDRQPDMVTVAADYPVKKKTLLFLISADEHNRKLLGLRWSDQVDAPVQAASEPASGLQQQEEKPCCEGQQAGKGS